MHIRYSFFPGGKRTALTMSYDDGRIHDRRLVEIFDEYGIHGTFHLNGGNLGKPGFIDAEEIPTLYRNHEVSCHTLTHPFLDRTPAEEVIREIMEDRVVLEKAAGYPMRGMSYPYGTYNEDVIRWIRPLGMEYARTTDSTHAFRIPERFLAWNPTCHHDEDLPHMLEEFRKVHYDNLPVFYIWGHSYEFNENNNWDMIRSFCSEVSALKDTWFATNIEIVDYMHALRSLRCSADRKILHNPTATDIWIEAEGNSHVIRGGETKKL